jgi:hypothetical protein
MRFAHVHHSEWKKPAIIVIASRRRSNLPPRQRLSPILKEPRLLVGIASLAGYLLSLLRGSQPNLKALLIVAILR